MAITFGGGITISAGVFNAGVPLNAPTITTATNLTSTTASVVYSAPFNNIGAPLLYYVATASPGGLTGTLSQAGSGTITVSGLTSGQTYTFTVNVYNQFGSSAVSTASYSVLMMINVPCAPTIGAVSTASGTSVNVAFTAPANNGGATITSYRATSSPGGINGTLSQAGSGTITVTGLTAGTTYTFTVLATNIAGNSSASSASASIKPVDPVGSQSYTTPGTYTWVAPSGVTTVSVVAVGGGGGGGASNSSNIPGSGGLGGGYGGGLGYKNNYSVTPGNSYTVVVGSGGSGSTGGTGTTRNSGTGGAGASGGNSYFCSTSVVMGCGGGGGSIGGGSGYTGSGGGYGGGGGIKSCCGSGGSGGGAGGYSGNGGAGHGGCCYSSGNSGSGGGGGGGGHNYGCGIGAGGGGGVGIFGQGSNGGGGYGAAAYNGNDGGSGGSGGGKGGQGGTQSAYILSAGCGNYGGHGGASQWGTSATSGVGGGGNGGGSSLYGGGGGGGAYGGGGGGGYGCGGYGGSGASGAVRIVWPGNSRQFPSTNVNYV